MFLRRSGIEGPVTEEGLARAIAYYEGFDLVGIADYLEESADILLERFGKPPLETPLHAQTFEATRANFKREEEQRTRREEVPEEIWERLCSFDDRLYRHFKARFEQEHAPRIFQKRKTLSALYAKLTADLAAERAEIKWLNEALEDANQA